MLGCARVEAMRRESNGALWRVTYAIYRARLPDTREIKVVYAAVLWNSYNKAQQAVEERSLSVCLHRIGVGVCRCGDSHCIIRASYMHPTYISKVFTPHTRTHIGTHRCGHDFSKRTRAIG